MMKPTEHEWQVATDAAAKAYWNHGGPVTPWEELAEATKRAYREAALVFVTPALEALPDRTQVVRDLLVGAPDPEQFIRDVRTLLA